MPTPLMKVVMGLNGRYRVRAISEPFAVGYWPLGQLASMTAWNILGHPSAHYMHAAYNGTGFTRAVTLFFPEGMLGLGFNNLGSYLEVQSDHLVSSGEYNLSGAGGALLLAFPIITSANDAFLRCIIQKQDTNATGNGYHVALQNGAIEFFLKVAGSTIFSFQRGAIADGLLHTVVCYYAPGSTNEARIYIDGVQSGSAVTGVSTEPQTTTANLRMGAFNDGTGWFWGTLGDMLMSRDAIATLSAELHATLTWTDVTVDTRVASGLSIRRGMTGTSMLDRVAGAGTLTLGLDNSAANSAGLVGYYSPGHANLRTGFALGTPIAVTIETTSPALFSVQFRGWIKRIAPTAGAFGQRVTNVVAVDWMDQAARVNVGGLEAQVNEESQTIFGLVVDRAGRPPVAVDIETGGEIFRYALDSAPTDEVTPLQEFARILASEFGQAFIRGDGTLVYQTRDTRQLVADNQTTFDNSMDELDVAYDADELVNMVRAIVYPREIGDTTGTVLATLTGEHSIGPGQIITIESLYRDPEQRASRVGGTDIQAPSSGVDYALNALADGSGTDLTAYLTPDVVDASTARTWMLTNTATQLGYLVNTSGETLLQVRGRIIRTFEPVPVIVDDKASRRLNDDHLLTYEMPYQSSIDNGLDIADYIVRLYKDEQAFVRSISFIANKSDVLLAQALTREIGDRIGIVETVTGIDESIAGVDAPRGYYIQSVAMESVGSDATGPILRCTWTLVPGPPGGTVWQLGIVGASEMGETTVLAL